MTTITRFAPSPTGFLHIGGARTALFNYLYAKHTGGKFLLRIEDTDRARSSQEAVDALIDGLSWLGLEWDDEIVFQFERAARHAEVARQLVERDQAYYCYTGAEELAAGREAAKAKGEIYKYDRKWRDFAGNVPTNINPSIRIKAPLGGAITIQDKVQGEVTVSCDQLDDMVLLRSDGTPTYMLAVVVDDHDVGVTQIIRGDDHLTNSFRQLMIYNAMGWAAPEFAHIPLIHGADGAKLSKRHGALGVDAYRDMGYLPEAICNYLLRLGWGHGDDEIIPRERAIKWFTLEAVGKSPSRFDFNKLENLNGHYMREADDKRLLNLLMNAGPLSTGEDISNEQRQRLLRGMSGLKQRAKNLNELAENAAFYITAKPLLLDAKAKEVLDKGGRDILAHILPQFEAITDWLQSTAEQVAREYSEATGQKLGAIAQPLRAALSGKTVSPGVFEVMEVLGKEETIARIKDVL